jgi:hypothetical protein
MLDDHENRIKALEKLQSMVEYHNRQVDRLVSHMIEAEQRQGVAGDVINTLLEYRNSSEQRIEGLEKALDEHLMQEMARRTGTGVSAPPQVGATNGDYAIFFDPKASPKNIPFSVALEFMKAGRRISRRASGWNMSATTMAMVDFVFMEGSEVRRHNERSASFPTNRTGPWFPLPEDMLATDWLVIPE